MAIRSTLAIGRPTFAVLATFLMFVSTGRIEAQSCPAGQMYQLSVAGVFWEIDQNCPEDDYLYYEALTKKGAGVTLQAALDSLRSALESTPVFFNEANNPWCCSPVWEQKNSCYPDFSNGVDTTCFVAGRYTRSTHEFYARGNYIDLAGDTACVNGYFGKKEPDGANLGRCKTCAEGNPINPANGNKFQEEIDYRGPGRFPLNFSRFYNSQDPRTAELGPGWRHTYSRQVRTTTTQPPHVAGASDNTALKATPQEACADWASIKRQVVGLAQTTANYSGGTCSLKEGSAVRGTLAMYQPGQPALNLPVRYVDRADGSTLKFTGWSSPYTAPAGVSAKLEAYGGGFRFTDENDVVEVYNSAGVLQSITYPGGVTQTLAYLDGKLVSVSDSFGHSLQFGYNATTGRLETLTDPAGAQYAYVYSTTGAKNLQKVTFPDTRDREYQYGYGDFPNVLTGIIDENDVLFASWTYDTMGRALTSQHNGGADAVTLTYNADGTTKATNALDMGRTQTFQDIGGALHTSLISRTCPGCTTATMSTTFTGGFVTSRTDFNGNETRYTRNARGLEESRTEAWGTALARTITTQWHATYRVPTQIDEPGRRTTFTHDGSGNVLTRTVTDLATNESRTTTWTYDSLGQVLTENGPRTDVSDVTTYTYSASHVLEKITNALGHETLIEERDLHGNATRVQDPNGQDTVLTWDARQRLKARTIDGKTTTFDHDGVGQLTKVTLPDGSFLSYVYDGAHRLTDIEDNAGNTIHYTLDALGNRTQEDVRDPQNVLKRTQAQVFDALSRLKQIRNAAGDMVSELGYDAQGNRTSQVDHIDANSSTSTSFLPDALNRIGQSTNADGTTVYGFNAIDQLISVTDPKGIPTTYAVNAFGDVTQQVSRDSGETDYSFDKAGNRISQTDARGVVVQYSFDALNRLTFVDYEGTAEDVAYSYDSAAQLYGKGRLTGAVDQGGSTVLVYDARGNVTEEQRTIDGTTYTTRYTFDAADRIASITYPGGRLVSYERNTLGQVSKVTTRATPSSSVQTLAEDIGYLPFGDIEGYKLGNGIVVTRSHNQDYRITAIEDQGSATIRDVTLAYDRRGNVEQIDDLLDASRSQGFSFDELSRLASADGAYGLQGFSYDAVGNRLSKSVTPNGGSTTTDTYAYPAAGPSASHRLVSQTSGPAYLYDDAGNATSDGTLSLSYNLANRLTSVTGGSAAVSNVYGANGQRIKKTANGVTRVFHYDQSGRLLAESLDSGLLLQREYIWLGDIPLAVASERKIPEFLVDNTDGAFSTTGGWSSASAADQYGSSYAKRTPAVEVPGQTIVDDHDAGASFTGTWVSSDACAGPLCLPLFNAGVSGEPNGGTFYRSGTTGTPVFTWNVALPGAGHYRVYVRWASMADSGAVTYAVTHANGTASFPVSQAIPSSDWYALGSYEFETSATITLTPDAGVAAVADAVRFVPLEDTDGDFATWLATGEPGAYEVFARWPSVGGASTAAPFTIVDPSGTTSRPQDQSTGGGQWHSLGEYSHSATTTLTVKLGAVWDQTVLADAVRFVPVEADSHRTNLAFFHVDHLNTPQKLTDPAQAVVWSAEYDPFGAATVTKTQHFDNPLRFAGQYADEETGLHQNWLRDYHPGSGRYLQSDPIGIAGGLSTYGYALSNPLVYTDPTGENPVLVYAYLRCVASCVGIDAALAYFSGGCVDATGIVGGCLVDCLNPMSWFKLGKLKAMSRTSGESAAAAAGRRAHQNYRDALGDGYDYKAVLDSGKKPDAVDWSNRMVRELKPDNARAVQRGERQVEQYRRELEQMTGERWTSTVDTYRSGGGAE